MCDTAPSAAADYLTFRGERYLVPVATTGEELAELAKSRLLPGYDQLMRGFHTRTHSLAGFCLATCRPLLLPVKTGCQTDTVRPNVADISLHLSRHNCFELGGALPRPARRAELLNLVGLVLAPVMERRDSNYFDEFGQPASINFAAEAAVALPGGLITRELGRIYPSITDAPIPASYITRYISATLTEG